VVLLMIAAKDPTCSVYAVRHLAEIVVQ